MSSSLFRFLVCAVGAALCIGLGTLFPSLWPLAPLGLTALFLLILYAPSNAGSALAGFLAGFAGGGAGVWWMWDMLPITSPPGISPLTQFIVAGSVWGMTALLAGITTALAALLLFICRRNVFFAPLAGVVWVLQEETRMWAYALFSWSPESLFGPHFSQTALGYALAENDYLLQLARFGGISALSFAVAVFAAGVALLLIATVRRSFEVRTNIATILMLVLFIAPLAPRPQPVAFHPLRIALLSLSSEPDAPRMKNLLREVVGKNPDLVIIPESQTLEYFFPEKSDREHLLRELFPAKEGLVLSGGYEQEGKNLYSILAYTDAQGHRIGSYKKRFLMPQGEYYPAAALPLFSLSGDPKMSEYVRDAGHRLMRGSEALTVPFMDHVIGGLICSELLSPHLYDELVRHYGANLLVNVANPSWFHGSRSYFDKTVQIAKVQAVATGMPLLVANTGSPSFAIEASGALVQMSVWGKDDVLVLDIGN